MEVPAEYTAILMGAVALYGGLSFIITQALRKIFPIENNSARVVAAIVAVGLGAWAAVQYALPLLSDLPPEQTIMVYIGCIGAVWWVAQELYRRIRADTWATKAQPYPET